jgi:hypothetical protein
LQQVKRELALGSAPGKTASDRVTTPDPETPDDAPEPPKGVLLEYPPSTVVRIRVRVSAGAQALVALPRLVLFALALSLVVVSWKHHVFLVFFGLPFLRWLRGGSRQTSLLVRERELEVESGHWLGGSLILPRSAVASIEIGRAGFTRLYQRALVVRLKDQRAGCLFVGLSAEQAAFVNGGLQRWMNADF